MKTYDVTIRATIVKTIRVQACDREQADWAAHEQFDVCSTDDPERYDQDTINIWRVDARAKVPA